MAVLVSVQESLHERLMATQRELEGEKRQSLTRIEEKLREKKTSHTQEKDKVNEHNMYIHNVYTPSLYIWGVGSWSGVTLFFL